MMHREGTLSPTPSLNSGNALHQSQNENQAPIAIVGLACRLPGGVDSPEGYWRLLDEGRDAIEPFPPERWSVEDLYSADSDAPGKTYCTQGGFVHGVDRFDAAFFGISPREAEAMEPAQRLALECVWELLERAAIRPADLAQSQTGVYFGAFGTDYEPWGGRQGMVGMNGYGFTGRDGSVLSGRISYTFGLQGPSFTVQTACSSSLVALHLASQALRAGECDLALCGGSQVMTTPGCLVEFSRLRAMSRDGRCKSFSDSADGVGWSEGCAVLLLQRLADAQRAGREVLAILRGTAVNHDGRSQGFTAPNGPAQQRMIEQALAGCGLRPDDIDAIEAHGTGTTLGDPIEASALAAVFGPGRPVERPLYVGSVKSNIGHTQAVSGVAGVIKLVLALAHERLPRSLYAETPSRRIPWQGSGLELLAAPRAWPRGARVRRAGVNSFGISGTNAHVILEEAPPLIEPASPPPTRSIPASVPLLLSGADHAALVAQAARLAAHLEERPQAPGDSARDATLDLAFTLATGRAHLAARLGGSFSPAAPTATIAAALRAFMRGEESGLWAGLCPFRPGKLVVLFPGQGSQRPEMGSRLAARFPAFRAALDALCAELDPHLPRPLREVLFAPAGSEAAALLDQTEFTQPALFAFSVALYRQWEAFGLTPDLLIGHSIGELAAAHVAGVLTLADACKLVAWRGRLMQRARPGGAMFAISASTAAVAELLLGLEDRVAIAAVNGPEQTVISGDAAAVEEVVDELRKLGKRARRLRVSHAFHSPHMDGILEEYRQVARTLSYRAPQIPVIGNVTGAILGERIASPEYWVRQLRGAVRFRDAIRAAEGAGADRYLECGPQAVLCAMAAECAQGAAATFLPGLAGSDEGAALGEALVRAHVAGVALRFDEVFAGSGARRVDLPTYAFQRQRYWISGAGQPEGVIEGAGLHRLTHEILGAETATPDGGHLFTARLGRTRLPWLQEHAVFDRVVVPAASLVDLLLAAGARVGATQVRGLTLEAPLLLDVSRRLHLRLEAPDAKGRREFVLSACASGASGASGEEPWLRHAVGTLEAAAPEASDQAAPPVPPDAVAVDLQGLYARLSQSGLRYGPCFQALQEVKRRGRELFARLELPPQVSAHGYPLHPVLLDAGFHAMMAGARPEAGLRIPFELRGLWVARAESSPRSLQVHVVLHEVDAAGMPAEASLRFYEEGGALVAALGWVGLRGVSAEKLREPASTRRRPAAGELYRYQWTARPGVGRPAGCAVIGSGDLANEVAAALRASGVSVLRCNQIAELDARLRQTDASITTVLRVVEARAAEGPDAALQETLELSRELAAWAAGPHLAQLRYALLTSRAVAARAGEAPDLAQAPLWGLLRTVRSETSPDQWLLVDTDQSEASQRALAAALCGDEPEAALREGERLIPRLVAAEDAPSDAPRPHGTVLISGGTGGLGAEVAKHLARRGGVGHLLLLSRQGARGAGAAALQESLEAMGCSVTLAACDVTDAAALQEVLAAIPAAHPLTGVYHCAAVLEDALAPSADRVTRVFAAKALGAFHLHQLTLGRPLHEFVLFSSIAGVIGNEGQSAYAAANTYLDALAASRRAAGLPAHALAWGTWAEVGMAARLSPRLKERIERSGFAPLDPVEALALMDRALRSPHPLLVPLRLEDEFLRKRETSLPLGRLLFGLAAPPPGKRTPGAARLSPRERIGAVAPAERARLFLELVRAEVAAVLKLADAAAIHEAKPLEELGMDSLMGVDIRRRLEKRLGVQLPPTLAFDHPTCGRMASYLHSAWQAEGAS